MFPFAPLGNNPPGLYSLPVPYTILKISAGVPAYEREFASAERMLLLVRFSAPRYRGTFKPSSLMPHMPSLLPYSERRLVNSFTVILYGSTNWSPLSYSNVRITASCPASTPRSPATNYVPKHIFVCINGKC